MLKDIDFKKVEHTALAIVPSMSDEGFVLHVSYIINLSDQLITNIMIRIQGMGEINNENIKTTTLRISIENLGPSCVSKIDAFESAAIELNNEYWISYWLGDYLYDKKYNFVPGSIHENNYTTIPFLHKKGVMIK